MGTEELLRRLGLDSSEIRVYLALLETGQTTTGPLVKKSGIPSSKIYHILGRLVENGLASYLHHGGVKYYRPSRPLALRHIADLKEQELQKTRDELEALLPSLESEFSAEKESSGVELLEGIRGIKTVYDLALASTARGGEMHTIGYPLLASSLFNAYFRDYHAQLAKKEIRAKIIYDHDTWFGKTRERRPHADQRYLPRGIATPAFIHIFKGHVAIMVVTERQKLAILIKNKEVEESYLRYFDLLWKVARKT